MEATRIFIPSDSCDPALERWNFVCDFCFPLCLTAKAAQEPHENLDYWTFQSVTVTRLPPTGQVRNYNRLE